MKKNKDKTFEQNLKIAKDIVHKLESGDCTLDDMLSLYQEGIESLKICAKKLSSFEQKVKVIRSDGENLNYEDIE